MQIKQTLTLQKLLIGAILACAAMATHATEKGLFWKLQSPTGVESYLFGTIHTDDNRVADISPTVVDAIKQVDAFMMESAENNDQSVMLLKSGNLAGYLTQDEFDQVRDLADFHVMHLGAALQMKPWLLAVIFDLPKPQTPFAQDNLLMRKAEDLSKDVIGIESAKEHFGVMDNFSMDEQLVMLRAVLKRTPEQKEADFERLMSAYLKGDSDEITALDEKITGGMLPKEIWAKMRAKLLDDRNVLMAERTTTLAKDKPVFIAVGASHLAGENGLIAAFKKAGFQLTPLKK
jgi:uncharacterized protein